MKHLVLFEKFEEHLDPIAREMFGLSEEIEITGSDFSIVGPSENYHLAKEIADRLITELTDVYEEAYDYYIDKGKKLAENEAYSAMGGLSNQFLEDEALKDELSEIGYAIKPYEDLRGKRE